MITESEMKEAALRGLAQEIKSSLSSRWGVGRTLDTVVTKTIEDNIPLIEKQIKAAMLSALASPEFVERLRAEMVTAMRNKFAGTFDGVMKAAGKRAAQDQIAADAIAAALNQGKANG